MATLLNVEITNSIPDNWSNSSDSPSPIDDRSSSPSSTSSNNSSDSARMHYKKSLNAENQAKRGRKSEETYFEQINCPDSKYTLAYKEMRSNEVITQLFFDKNYQLLRCVDYETSEGKQEYEYLPNHSIKITKNDGSTNTIQLEFPWMQEFTFSLRKFLEDSTQNETTINIYQPKGNLQKLRIEKQNENAQLILGNKIYETIQLLIYPPIIGAYKFWHATLWYNKENLQLLKREAAGWWIGQDTYPVTELIPDET